MDYPFYRKQRYDVSNNWWFLPTDLFEIEKEKQAAIAKSHESPILSYIEDISGKNKFKYAVIIIIIIVFVHHLNLGASIWIGLVIAVMIIYYLNEIKEQELHDESDKMWAILRGPLLKNTHYFITDPVLIRWVDNVGEFKKFNVLVFNNMIKTLDHMLRLVNDVKKGVHYCKENLDIIRDLKTSSLNQFHSLVHHIPVPQLRRKFNYYLSELGKLLNEHYLKLIRVCHLYYMQKPIDIDSRFDITTLGEPCPDDPEYDSNYNFYN